MLQIILVIVIGYIALHVIPYVIGYVLGMAAVAVREIITNLDVIIPAIILYLPIKILQFTNWLQFHLQKPWRFMLKQPGSVIKWVYDNHINWLVEALLYVALTPLRAFNAIAYNIVVRNVFMLFDMLGEIFNPQLGDMRYYSGWDYFWRWLLYMSLRILYYSGKFVLSLLETVTFTIVEIIIPTLTLYHGTSHDASTSIARPNEWRVGGGAFAGYGIYFAPNRSTAFHYSCGIIIVCRVTLGRIENLNLHPYICEHWVAKRGHSITKWAIDNGITTVEWWRTTGSYRWWEYCMVDHENAYDHPWRIRPLYREYAATGKYARTWGGTSLWTPPIYRDIFGA